MLDSYRVNQAFNANALRNASKAGLANSLVRPSAMLETPATWESRILPSLTLSRI
jgi:hypothetical protein